MPQNTIKSLSINDTETPYPFDSLELINREYTIKAVLSSPLKGIRMKFQRGFHPQEISVSFHFSNKCLKESVYLKADNDVVVFEVPQSEPLVEVVFQIEKTYDHFNRLVIYEISGYLRDQQLFMRLCLK